MVAHYYIGLMSGTSLDGIDSVICTIDTANQFSLYHCASYPIPRHLKQELLSLSQNRALNELDQYARLDVQMGHLFADCCLWLLDEHKLQRQQIHAIGCHGQTLRHYPDNDYPTTLQIGDPNIIAQRTGITTIADFRRRDMAAGGQGAPLVPPFHQALFSQHEKCRVVLNIGGIANITFLPGTEAPVTGYDTGPGNGLMDDWCSEQFNCAYDDSGQLAAQGDINQKLLKHLLAEPFFSQHAPKSTGREYFSYPWLQQQLKSYNKTDHKDILATLLELTCQTISNEILSLRPIVDDLLVCGGGVKNTRLMQRLQELMSDIRVHSTEDYGLHPDWVEACAFAWLAHRTLNGLSGNLPSVTGADSAVILGAIWQA